MREKMYSVASMLGGMDGYGGGMRPDSDLLTEELEQSFCPDSEHAPEWCHACGGNAVMLYGNLESLTCPKKRRSL